MGCSRGSFKNISKYSARCILNFTADSYCNEIIARISPVISVEILYGFPKAFLEEYN